MNNMNVSDVQPIEQELVLAHQNGPMVIVLTQGILTEKVVYDLDKVFQVTM